MTKGDLNNLTTKYPFDQLTSLSDCNLDIGKLSLNPSSLDPSDLGDFRLQSSDNKNIERLDLPIRLVKGYQRNDSNSRPSISRLFANWAPLQ